MINHSSKLRLLVHLSFKLLSSGQELELLFVGTTHTSKQFLDLLKLTLSLLTLRSDISYVQLELASERVVKVLKFVLEFGSLLFVICKKTLKATYSLFVLKSFDCLVRLVEPLKFSLLQVVFLTL
jgi:hypothetical protein